MKEGWAWISHLQMACCISNTISYGWNRSPYCLFGWNIGKKKIDDREQTKYHDNIDLPFSLSLVDKTFLRGILFFLYLNAHEY